MPDRGVRRHRVGHRLAAVVAAALLGGALTGCGPFSSPLVPSVRTATVERGSVDAVVRANGALQAVTQQNLGFVKGGELVVLNVNIGDRVSAGQTVASVDQGPARSALQQARASLSQAQANLNNTVDGNSVQRARDALASAQANLQALEDQAETVQQADQSAIDSAEKQVAFDERQLEAAEQRLEACGGLLPSCAAEQQAVDAAKRALVASKAALDAAEQKLFVDQAQFDVLISQARGQVSAAEGELTNQTINRPNQIQSLTAAVSSAQAQVQNAQRDLDDTVLRSPVDGTVAVINGTLGEIIGPNSSTTPLSPGSRAALPGADTPQAGAAGTAAAGGSVVGAAPGRPFIVLADVAAFQVVGQFPEADAVRVQPNQGAKVSFEAIPELIVPGTVLSVAPTASSTAGVISYFVTVVVSQPDPRLRAGLTSSAAVIVTQLNDVLVVPNAAVQQVGAQNVVTLVVPGGGQQQVPVQVGLVGDTNTQILSGLSEGQVILLPPGS